MNRPSPSASRSLAPSRKGRPMEPSSRRTKTKWSTISTTTPVTAAVLAKGCPQWKRLLDDRLSSAAAPANWLQLLPLPINSVC